MDGSRASKRARTAPSAKGKPDDAALKLQSAFRGFKERTSHSLATRRREKQLERADKERSSQEAAVVARSKRPEYRMLARLCPDANASDLARVDLALEQLVGLQPLKEYCSSVREDSLARAALGEPPLVRNVLISGNLGVGKKLAADTLCSLLRALGVAKGMQPTRTTLESMALDVRRDNACVVVEGLDRIEGQRSKVDAILANFPRHCFIFLGPTERVEALHGAVSHFRKVDPAWLQLPNYTPAELARISAAALGEKGYALAAGLGVADLQQALCATWARDVLAMRNAHLCAELVQRAITHRNRRQPLTKLLSAPPTLDMSDLGMQSEGLESLLADRAALDDEIQSLVGMLPLKAFLDQLRAKVEFVSRGADPRLLEGCLNVVLTGNPGAGKTTAARLLFRALRSYGLLKSNVFVERNALELKGTHIGWTCPQVKEMVQAALGGCLFLDEAYALSGGGKDGERGDSFSDEALRTLLTETENNRTSLCVVLAGYREAMAGLMKADPGLVRRFPTTIDLDDYTAAELAAIAKQTAYARFGLRFADGLEAALAQHIAAKHSAEIAEHNASLSVALVEAAINRLAMRIVKGGGQSGAGADNKPPTPTTPQQQQQQPWAPLPPHLAVPSVSATPATSPASSAAPSRLGHSEACTLVAADFLIESP